MWTEQEEQATREEVEMPEQQQQSSLPPTPFAGYDLSRMTTAEHSPAMSQPTWAPITFSTSLPTTDASHRFPSRAFHLPMSGSGDALSTSIDSMSEADYMSPLTHSFPREDIAFATHTPSFMYDHFQGHTSPVTQTTVSAIMIEPQRPPLPSCPSLVYSPSEHSSSLPSHLDNYDAQLSHKLVHEVDALGKPHCCLFRSDLLEAKLANSSHVSAINSRY
jgi:hypothetical protein